MSLKSDDDGGEHSDHAFLDNVLSRLYDFGDGAHEKGKNKSLKSKRKKSNEEVEYTSADSDNFAKAGDWECSNSRERIIAVGPAPVPVPESFEIGNTTPSVKNPAQVEIVTFRDPSKKRKTKNTPAPEVKPSTVEEKKKIDQKDSGLNLEQARLEVHRFGITGYQKEQQRLFEQERAIMLGAKPPKREYVNYKVYQQMIKEKKLKAKEEAKLDNKKKKKRESKDRGEKKPTSSSIPTGQVGRFKNGMLVLSSKEIQRIKSSKVIK